MLTHIHPGTHGLLPRSLHCSPALQCPATRNHQVPRAPLHEQVLPRSSWSKVHVSRDYPPSSLLRAHAPVLHPPRASVMPNTRSVQVAVSPCWGRTFPTFLCDLSRAPGPLPRWLLRCSYPFLPRRHRPSPRSDRVSAPQSPCSDFSTGPLSRLQSFADVQARRCAYHPGRSYRYGVRRMAAVVFTSSLRRCYLPTPRICLPSASGN